MFKVISKLVYGEKVVGARIILDGVEGLDKFYDIDMDIITEFGVDLEEVGEIALQKEKVDESGEKYTIYLTQEELESGRQVKELIKDDRIDYSMVTEILTNQEKGSEFKVSEPDEPVFIRIMGFEEVTGSEGNTNFMYVSFEGYDDVEVEKYRTKYGFWRSPLGYIKLTLSDFNSLTLGKYINEELKVVFLDSKTGTTYSTELKEPNFDVDIEFAFGETESNIGEFSRGLLSEYPIIRGNK